MWKENPGERSPRLFAAPISQRTSQKRKKYIQMLGVHQAKPKERATKKQTGGKKEGKKKRAGGRLNKDIHATQLKVTEKKKKKKCGQGR